MSWIPLLSKRALADFTAAEFKQHVRGLFFRREKRVRNPKPKPAAVTWKLTPKGKLTVKVRRDPKWISPDERRELEVWSFTQGIPANEVFLTLKRLKIQIMNQSEAEAIAGRMIELNAVWPKGAGQ